MRIAIVDDNLSDRQELLRLLTQYLHSNRLEASCAEFHCAEAFLADFIPRKYDLVFLDVYMAEMSGMDAARRVYAADTQCRLIFFTTSHAHAVESYDVRAAYYLTKPLAYERFASAMDSCCTNLVQNSQYLGVQVGHMETKILLCDILYADCAARKARIHLAQQDIVVDENISTVMDSLLRDKRFLCCNRNVVVNMQHITGVCQDDFSLSNGIRIPIRQRGKISVKQQFLEYSLQDLRKESP
ncbi:MAG: LytTR family DNA-binding domain-containing protein [Christensenella sp.]|nr:LytTR family DNA-binding domain-containing protein [Christensenella sp.]